MLPPVCLEYRFNIVTYCTFKWLIDYQNCINRLNASSTILSAHLPDIDQPTSSSKPLMKQKCKTDQSLYIFTIRPSDIELPQHFPVPVGEIISPTVWLTLIVWNDPCGLGNKREKHCTSLSLSRLPRLLSWATLLWYPSNRHKEAGPPQGAGSSLLRRPGF